MIHVLCDFSPMTVTQSQLKTLIPPDLSLCDPSLVIQKALREHQEIFEIIVNHFEDKVERLQKKLAKANEPGISASTQTDEIKKPANALQQAFPDNPFLQFTR